MHAPLSSRRLGSLIGVLTALLGYALTASADEVDDVIMQAKTLNRSGEPESRRQAVKVLRDAIDVALQKTIDNPRDAAAYYRMSRLHTELSEDAAAIEAIDHAVRLDPLNAAYLNQQVTALLYAKKYQRTIAPLERLVELAPDDASISERLATVYVKSGDYSAAGKLYRALLAIPAVTHQPQRAIEIEALLGHALRLAGETGEATGVLETLLQRDPKYAAARVELGMCYEASGRLDEAARQYDLAIETSPDLESALQQAASVAAQQKRQDDFTRFRQKLIDLHRAGKAQGSAFERDAFRLGDKYKIHTYELYELVGPKAVRYHFEVKDLKSGESFRISLGSYDLTTQIMQAQGTINTQERGWHLDLYRGPKHETYGIFTSEPTYDQIRSMVVEILEGTRAKLSGGKPPPQPGAPATIELPSGQR